MRTWVQSSSKALSNTLHHLWVKIFIISSQCLCFPSSDFPCPPGTAAKLEEKMDLYNLSTAYLPACCKDEPLCPIVLRGLWLRFMTCSGLRMVHKVMLLHKVGWFLQGLDRPLQQKPRRYSASPLRSVGYLKQPSTEEHLTMSSLELLLLLSFYAFVQKSSRKCFVIVRNSKKKILLKPNSIW